MSLKRVVCDTPTTLTSFLYFLPSIYFRFLILYIAFISALSRHEPDGLLRGHETSLNAKNEILV